MMYEQITINGFYNPLVYFGSNMGYYERIVSDSNHYDIFLSLEKAVILTLINILRGNFS